MLNNRLLIMNFFYFALVKVLAKSLFNDIWVDIYIRAKSEAWLEIVIT